MQSFNLVLRITTYVGKPYLPHCEHNGSHTTHQSLLKFGGNYLFLLNRQMIINFNYPALEYL